MDYPIPGNFSLDACTSRASSLCLFSRNETRSRITGLQGSVDAHIRQHAHWAALGLSFFFLSFFFSGFFSASMLPFRMVPNAV
jgi:hypothetical protein